MVSTAVTNSKGQSPSPKLGPQAVPAQRLKQIALPQPEIMTTHEVAAYLRVTVRHVTNMAHKGVIPGMLVGSIWRFKRASIESLV